MTTKKSTFKDREHIWDCYWFLDCSLGNKFSKSSTEFFSHHALRIATKEYIQVWGNQNLNSNQLYPKIFPWWQGRRDESNFLTSMAAANPQPHNTLNPFREKADENWSNFECLLGSPIIDGNIPNAYRPQFLQRHVLDQTLQLFTTLP